MSEYIKVNKLLCMEEDLWGGHPSDDNPLWYNGFSNVVELKYKDNSVWGRLVLAFYEDNWVEGANDSDPHIKFDLKPLYNSTVIAMSVQIFKDKPEHPNRESARISDRHILGFASIQEIFNFKLVNENNEEGECPLICRMEKAKARPDRKLLVLIQDDTPTEPMTANLTFTMKISMKDFDPRNPEVPENERKPPEGFDDNANWILDVDPRIRAGGTN